MGAYNNQISFLDEAAKLIEEGKVALPPVWVQAAAARFSERGQKMSAHSLVIKRAFDLTAILLSAPFWLPIMLLTALAVTIDSRGSAFFKQKRTGLNGEVFSIYKFRTMHEVTETDGYVKQSKANDSRHTRIGRILRRTSLDELPQLLNVLKGDMSLIGPRPHAQYHDQLFMHYAEGYADRFRMRPGLTGWAQVHGQRGLLNTQAQLQARTDFDNDYIERWSLWMDIKILFKTVLVVFKATNAH